MNDIYHPRPGHRVRENNTDGDEGTIQDVEGETSFILWDDDFGCWLRNVYLIYVPRHCYKHGYFPALAEYKAHIPRHRVDS